MSYLDKLKAKKSYVEVYKENKNKKSFQKDERLWTPTLDKLGNSYSVIRFLERNEKEMDDTNPYLGPVYTHSFKNPSTNMWFIENCPRTIDVNGNCPVCDYNKSMFQLYEKEVAKKKTGDTRGKASYYANILVLKDNGNPENNGKVFLYKFGKSIMDKIKLCLEPQFEEEVAFNPFDIFNGANFILKTKKKGEFLNFDDSRFDAPSPISKSDSKIEEILSQTYCLNDMIDPSNFKSYETLKTRFDSVMNTKISPSTQKHFEDSITEEIGHETEEEILSSSKSTHADEDDLNDILKDIDDFPF